MVLGFQTISDDPMDGGLVKYSTITMLTTIVTCTSRNRHEVCKLNNNYNRHAESLNPFATKIWIFRNFHNAV